MDGPTISTNKYTLNVLYLSTSTFKCTYIKVQVHARFIDCVIYVALHKYVC